MSRRSGQNPSVRVGKRADGTKYFFFQYWVDVPGQEERQRKTEVIGLVSKMTKSEAERKKLEFISALKINSDEYRIPSCCTFADAVKHYREDFGPRMLRDSTRSNAEYHIRPHLEPDWNDVPIEHITIDAVNEWAWKKRGEGLSWGNVKNILRTMQRVLSAFSKNHQPPFSLKGLTIPEQDKLQMRIKNRKAISFSWKDAQRIAKQVGSLDLDDDIKERDASVFILAAATGLRAGELLALRMDDLDFNAGTVRVDESVNQWTGQAGPCKNAAAYRTVVLEDSEGQQALRMLKRYVGGRIQNAQAFVFASRLGTPLRESNVLSESLHPALGALGLPKAGMHGFRHGCNRRWELAGIKPAVIRQQMGHSSESMTVRYTGEISVEEVRASYSIPNGAQIAVLENMENEAVA
jgi:integrase